MSRSRTDASLIADRYATALFALAGEHNALDTVAADLKALASAMESDVAVKRLIAHPIAARSSKADAFSALLSAKKAHALTVSTITTLAHAGRLEIVPMLAEAFAKKLAASRGIVEAVVTSARPLSAPQQKSVAAAVAKATGKEASLVLKIDPSLIGGLKLQLGSKELDMSLAGALERTRRTLKDAA